MSKRKFNIGDRVVCVAKTEMRHKNGKTGTVKSYGRRIYWVYMDGETYPLDFYACELTSEFKKSDLQPDRDWS